MPDETREPAKPITEHVHECPITLSDAHIPLLQIDQVPIFCNVIWPTRAAALDAPRGDIHLVFCPDSGHMFNTAFDPAKMEYTQQYENSLHFSAHFQDFASSLARRLVDAYDLHGKHIIEIGSGKGDFLHMLCEIGDNHGVGFDPSYSPDEDAHAGDPRTTFVQDYYSDKYASYHADLICCRHVLEHLRFPRQFLESVRRTIGDRLDTVVYFEVPDGGYTLRETSVWDLIYEHFSHFTIPSLARIFIESGFEVRRIQELFGGQFLGIEAVPAPHVSGDAWLPWSDLSAISAHVLTFADRYREKLRAWQQTLARMAAEERRVVIWGAGSKGVTFLNLLKAQDIVAYAVDINPRKQGRYVAGTGQQIVAPGFLRDYRPDVVIIMNPLYREEIQHTVAELGLAPEFLVV